jgi:hypothetical protein
VIRGLQGTLFMDHEDFIFPGESNAEQKLEMSQIGPDTVER